MAKIPIAYPVSTPTKKPARLIEFPGGTPRLCGNCDHFEAPTEKGKKGSCHNLISGTMFVRAVDKACPNGFYPDIVRFPIHVLMGIKPAKED